MLRRPTHTRAPSDVYGPEFLSRYGDWKAHISSEMQETVAATRRTIEQSKALIAEIDRVLAVRPCRRS
jgi:hypothetical protein